MNNKLLLSFYGDDFTGSADAMESLSLNGVRTALFLEPPAPEELQGRFAELQAIGVAGVSRSMTPAQMDEKLPDVFNRMKQLGAEIFHYKVCSTFDSSPEIGSIGHALDLGQEAFASEFVPLLVGAPALKRYCLFGNLFATVGDETFRIDRHPTMRHHPITPMRESDLRIHLAQQTQKRITLFDILQLTGTPDELDRRLDSLLETKPDVVLFDVLDDERLMEAGRLIWSHRGEKPLFTVASSGLGYALTAYWQSKGLIEKAKVYSSTGPVEKLIVVSGSCSPVTKGQIEYALRLGFVGIRLDVSKLIDESQAERERASLVRQALDGLNSGPGVLLYSALGPDDSEIKTNQKVSRGPDGKSVGALLGAQQGKILRELLGRTGLRRAVIAGGDTSGHAARELGIYALELLMPIAPGSPLCRASSHEALMDDLEIALKGGQGGEADYFEAVMRGGVA